VGEVGVVVGEGRPEQAERLLVGRRDEDVAHQAEPRRRPRQSVADRAALGRGAEALEEELALLPDDVQRRRDEPEAEDHVVALVAQPRDRGGVRRRVPQRRVRPLAHRHVQRDALPRCPRTAEDPGLQRLEDRRHQLLEALRRLRPGQAEHRGLVR
jgi:hypothetical protein